MRTWAGLVAVALTGCLAGEVDPPLGPPLAPVERTVAWHAVLTDADPTAQSDALAVLGDDTAGTVLGGAIVGGLDDATLGEVAEAALRVSSLGERPVALAVPGLSGAATPTCFDAADPLTDAVLQTRRAALADVLSTVPELTDVLIDPVGAFPPWDLPCTCGGCEDQAQLAQAAKLAAVYGALEAAALDEGATPWWRDDLAAEAPESEPWMEAALGSFRPESTLAVTSEDRRGPHHAWSPPASALDLALSRAVAVDVDPTLRRFGTLAAPVVDAHGFEDRLKQQRAAGVRTWFVAMHGPRNATDPLRAGNLAVFRQLFASFDADATAATAAWLQAQYGLAPEAEGAAALAAAMAWTGRAAELATHPLGLEVADPAGFPSELPLVAADATGWNPDWSQRVAQWSTPSLDDLAAIHQWGHEGVALADAARAAVDDVPSLSAGARNDLEDGLDALAWWTRAWHAAVDGAATAAYLATTTDDAARSWLIADADALDALADAPAGAGLPSASLRAFADLLRPLGGDAPAADRPFPTITRVSWDQDDDQTNIRWRIEPEGGGWLEHDGDWPLYLDESDRGEGPDHNWRAWLRELPSDSRVIFRACGDANGYVVCSSDHALWTQP